MLPQVKATDSISKAFHHIHIIEERTSDLRMDSLTEMPPIRLDMTEIRSGTIEMRSIVRLRRYWHQNLTPLEMI